MNKAALLRLADKLEGKGPYEKVGPIPKERFNMETWVVLPESEDDYAKGLPFVMKNGHRVVKPNLPCGTAACAVGWAGSDSWFRKRGFYTGANGGFVLLNVLNGEQMYYFSAWETVADFFKIKGDEALYLFGEQVGNRTPKQVAKRIRDFVKEEEKHEL